MVNVYIIRVISLPVLALHTVNGRHIAMLDVILLISHTIPSIAFHEREYSHLGVLATGGPDGSITPRKFLTIRTMEVRMLGQNSRPPSVTALKSGSVLPKTVVCHVRLCSRRMRWMRRLSCVCQALESADENEKNLRNYVGYGPETWVSVDNYEKAMASGEEIKQKMLEEYSGDVKMTEERRSYIAKWWPRVIVTSSSFAQL